MLRTTYRKQGDGTAEYDYYEKRRRPDGSVDILGWGVYGSSSVLAGQAMKSFLDTYETEELADAALTEIGIYPKDVHWNHPMMEPQVSYNHLTDEEDY